MHTSIYKFILSLIFTIIISVFNADAQELYKVDVTNSLNVRTAPSMSSSIVTKIYNNEYVTVMNVNNNGWVEIKYKNKTGFVKKQYLKKINIETKESVQKRPDVIEHIRNQLYFIPQNYANIFFYIAISLLSILTLFHLVIIVIEDKDAFFDLIWDNKYISVIINVAFISLCICELLYLLLHEGDVSWFVTAKNVSKISAFVNLCLFFIFMYEQFLVYHLGIVINFDGDRETNYKIGYGSAYISSILIAISTLIFDFDAYITKFLCLVYLLLQGIQISLIIIHSIREESNFFNTLYTIFFYIIGTISLSIIIYCFFYENYEEFLFMGIMAFIVHKIYYFIKSFFD